MEHALLDFLASMYWPACRSSCLDVDRLSTPLIQSLPNLSTQPLHAAVTVARPNYGAVSVSPGIMSM